MSLTTLKDYAASNHISYEAIRQQVVRYRAELGDHIVKDGRQQFLDDDAVAFLDGRRAKNPVVVYNASKDEELDRLKQENAQLLRENAALHAWRAENAIKIAEAEQTQKLLSSAQADLDAMRLEVDVKTTELENSRQEAVEAAQRADTAISDIQVLKEQLAQEKAAREAVEADNQALKSRGLIARIFRKGEHK